MTSPARPGTWPSPLTTAAVVAGSVGLGDVRVDEDDLVWSEARPEEGGRVALVRHRPDGSTVEVLPAGWSARTRVHEYGGGAWWVHDDVVFVSSWEDQRLYRVEGTTAPQAITPEPACRHGWRYADGSVTPDAGWVVCVRETHEPDGAPATVRNEVVALPTHGESEPVVLVGDRDFVSSPRVDSTGTRLLWLAWDHPHMPWDAAELWVARISFDSGAPRLTDPRRLIGGAGESVTQPEWQADATVLAITDRSGWWNLVRLRPDDAGPAGAEPEPLTTATMDLGVPAWVFGQSRYAVLADGRIAVVAKVEGIDQLHLVHPPSRSLRPVDTGFTAISSLQRFGGGVALIGASFTTEPVIAALDIPDGPGGRRAVVAVIREPRDLGIDAGWWSVPEHVTFPTTDGEVAHALVYPPTHPSLSVPPGAAPPLVVAIHGGPTSAARSQLSLEVQFWTTRGFAVADVNYRGSTGYGRAYRDRLQGEWGILDVADCLAAAGALVRAGRADPDALAIRGGSAGGFTVLGALTAPRGAGEHRFGAGCSRYGVVDLSALARDTHKFESRYLDGLVGCWPEDEAVYRERSPIEHLDALATPLLVLQGLEDEVVPPSQAEMLVAALAAKAVPHAYLAFEGEQHGFRQAATIERALGAELYFLARVFGFEPADVLGPVAIVGLPDAATDS